MRSNAHRTRLDTIMNATCSKFSSRPLMYLHSNICHNVSREIERARLLWIRLPDSMWSNAGWFKQIQESAKPKDLTFTSMASEGDVEKGKHENVSSIASLFLVVILSYNAETITAWFFAKKAFPAGERFHCISARRKRERETRGNEREPVTSCLSPSRKS